MEPKTVRTSPCVFTVPIFPGPYRSHRGYLSGVVDYGTMRAMSRKDKKYGAEAWGRVPVLSLITPA